MVHVLSHKGYWLHVYGVYVELARTIYIQCTYGMSGREIIKDTVIYGVYTRF